MEGIENGRELVRQILVDPQSAPIPERDKVLYAAIDTFTAGRTSLGPEVHAGLRRGGWSEAEIFHAATVCALFCFYNAWVDIGGHDELQDSDYEMSGRRLAGGNYLGA